MLSLPSFDEALSQTDSEDDKQLHLLLGNGFSVGAHPEFAYDSLYYVAQRSGLPQRAVQIFSMYSTSNFEEVLRVLSDTARVSNLYGYNSSEIANDYEEIKQAFVDVIARVHPLNHHSISASTMIRIGEWLDVFDSVFTVNYDLLLYWVLMEYMRWNRRTRFQDGFGTSLLYGDGSLKFQAIGMSEMVKPFCFLHGALHLYREKGYVRKHTRFDADEQPLIEAIRDALTEGRSPLIVAEGESESKLATIESSSYLWEMLGAFRRIKGTLMTVGWSLGTADDHLLHIICANPQVTNLVVGVYDEPTSEPGQGLIDRANGLQARAEELRNGRYASSGLNVSCFDAKTVELW